MKNKEQPKKSIQPEKNRESRFGINPITESKKRYFIVFYEAGIRKGTDVDGKERGGGMVSGNIPLTSTSGKYVNMKNVEKLVFESRMDKDGKSAFVGIVFRNIVELNSRDFKEFIR